MKAVYFSATTLFFTLVFLIPLNTAFAATVVIASVDSDGLQGSGSFSADGINFLSEDGRHVVFDSSSTILDLVLPDTNGVTDVFAHDTVSGDTHRISLATGGAQATGGASHTPSISYDGRYVAFTSAATDLVAGDTNAVSDVFVHDRDPDADGIFDEGNGTTVRVSVDSTGDEAGDGASLNGFISGNGRYVSFASDATDLDLVDADTNATTDIFVHDLQTGATVRTSADASDVGSDLGTLVASSLSEDGTLVAFASGSTNLVPGYASGTLHIYVKNISTGAIEIVSVDDDGIEGGSSSRAPFISGDGRFVAFESFSTNLADEVDDNGSFDIFVYDRDTDTVERVSVSSAGAQSDGSSLDSSISYDGDKVFFWSDATNLVSGDTNDADIFVFDRSSGSIELVSSSAAGVQANAGGASYGSISADGTTLAFASAATNLVVGDGNGVSDIFVKVLNSAPTDIALSDSSIDENQDSGTAVGTLSVTDADGADTHTYSLACAVPGADDASFSISGSSLLSAEEFNYEDKDSYAICIRVNDGNGGTYDENFTITIGDEGESSSGSSGNGGNNNNPPPPPPPPSPIDPPPPVDEPIDDEELPPPPPIDEPIDDVDPIPEDLDDNEPVPTPENENPNDGPIDNILEDRNDFEIRELPGLIAGAVVEFVAEVPKEVADTISVIGVALPTIIFAVSQPAVAANVISIPLRLSNLIPIWLGLRRKKRPWGTVYDSVTKQPLDPVYVTLKDSRGKVVATTITDLDGRFGFLVPPGRYKISAKKDDYVFPSRKLAGKTSDELYSNLYFGADIEITGTESLVINNIAMDSTSFNWNEFEKAKNKQLMKFYSKRDVFLARIAEVSFWGGLVFSVALLFIGPGTLNYVLFGIYAFVLILRFLGVKPKKPGYVVETVTGFPLSFGLVRIFSAKLGKEVAHAVISKTGRYYALVPKGEYYLSIDKKVGEDEYREVYKSDIIKTKKGFIGESFKV